HNPRGAEYGNEESEIQVVGPFVHSCQCRAASQKELLSRSCEFRIIVPILAATCSFGATGHAALGVAGPCETRDADGGGRGGVAGACAGAGGLGRLRHGPWRAPGSPRNPCPGSDLGAPPALAIAPRAPRRTPPDLQRPPVLVVAVARYGRQTAVRA